MRQFSAAALTPAFRLVAALFLSPRGRHASSVGRRRRRSTRVRRYAPVPAPAPAVAPAAALPPKTLSRPAAPPRPAAVLAPPSHTVEAEDVALVRPYYDAHERELRRVQAEASARLHRWVPRPRVGGDLLAEPFAPFAAGAWVPAPRSPAPESWDDLAAATHPGLDRRRGREVAV